jgi:hypothetical protein
MSQEQGPSVVESRRGEALKTRKALHPLQQGMDADSLEAGILTHLEFTLGELPKHVDSEWEPTAPSANTPGRSGG